MKGYLLAFSVFLTLCAVVGFINASYLWSAKDSWIKQVAKICTIIASSIGLVVSVMIMLYEIQQN